MFATSIQLVWYTVCQFASVDLEKTTRETSWRDWRSTTVVSLGLFAVWQAANVIASRNKKEMLNNFFVFIIIVGPVGQEADQ